MDDQDEQLESLRRKIDELDAQLIKLLALRMRHIKNAGKYKQAHGLPALDETRWKQATEARLQQARTLGLSERLVTELYELIHAHTLQMERDLGAK